MSASVGTAFIILPFLFACVVVWLCGVVCMNYLLGTLCFDLLDFDQPLSPWLGQCLIKHSLHL